LFHHAPYSFANVARGIVPAMLMRMQATREQQLDEMDIDISRRMRSVILSS
jgi:hypothetical protein